MNKTIRLLHGFAFGVCATAFSVSVLAQARIFNIPAGDMKAALDAYSLQSGVQIIYRVDDVQGQRSPGASGTLTPDEALKQLLKGTSLDVTRDPSNAVVVHRVSAADPASPSDAASLGIVTVTAQKRPEAAQTVPISLTNLSAATIDTYHVQTLQDVARLTPGLLVSAFSKNNPTIAIRGTSNTFSQIGVSKPVAVVIDDVFVPRNSAASFQLFDLDSITVLKGPQGTLFGRNVTGGAIVINTRKPSLDARDLQAQVTYGNQNDKQFDGLVSVPINDVSAVKFSTSLQSRAGYGVDRLTGRREDDIHSQNYRGQWRLAPRDDLEILLSADYGRDTSGGRTLSSNTLGDDGNRRTSELGVPQGFARTIWGTSARVNWETPRGDFTSITAWRTSESGEDYSGVGANYSVLTSGAQAVVRDDDQVGTFSQELRYASPKWSRGDFLTGIYLTTENGKRQLGTNGLAARTGALTSSTLADQRVRTRSYAAFADGTLHLLPVVDLTAGARYTWDEKTASLLRTDLVNPANTFSAGGLQHTWHEWTPRVAVNWRVTPDAMTYASVTKGFTAGGFNGEASSLRAFNLPFDPETVTNYETGLKSQWFDNRLRFNLAIFRMKYKDKQELVNNMLTGILSINNASRATIKGAEVEVAWRPVSWLGMSLNYANLDAIYDQFVIGTVNNTGNPLGQSPHNTWSAATDARWPVAGRGAIVGSANYAWTQSYYTGATKDPNLLIPAYGLVNSSLGYESADRRWRVMSWIKNLTNTKYILTRSTQVVRSEYLGEPRTFGVTLSTKF